MGCISFPLHAKLEYILHTIMVLTPIASGGTLLMAVGHPAE